MCNKIGVRFHHVCILSSPRTCIPVIPERSRSVSAGQRDLILLFRDGRIHEMWKLVWSICWPWLDHILNSFLDSKPGDAATGIVFCQTSKYWKDAVMGALCLNTDLGWSEKSGHSQRDALPSGAGRRRRDLLSSPSAIDLLMWHSVALQPLSMSGDGCT